MAWTTPRTWVTDELVSSALMNTHLRDNLIAVHNEYTTSLAGPADGDIKILVNSLTASTFYWQFRWNESASSAYKWEFIGGSMFISAASNLSFANQLSYVTSAVALTVPREGDYEVHVMGTNQANTGNTGYWTYAINGTSQGDSKASRTDSAQAGALHLVDVQTGLAVGASVAITYRASNSGSNHSLENARIGLLPRRIT